MAQIKTPYGLVYNTDGSLCATYRDDDIPFAGVRSFAVEEATENLYNNHDMVIARNWNGENEIIDYPKAYSGKALKTDTTMIDFLNCRGAGLLATGLTIGNTYTLSFYFEDLKGDWSTGAFRIFYIGTYSNANWSKINKNRAIINFTAASSNIHFFFGWYKQVSVIVYNIQIEEKPFATSFVDGIRLDGLIKIRLDLDVNDTVVNFWFKIGSIFELDSEYGTRIIAFSEDVPTQNRFFIRADGVTNDAILKFYDSIDGVGPSLRRTVEGIDLVKWNMFTIVFDNGLIKIYLNENLLTQYTVSLNPIALKYLNIPENTPEYLKTGFWSNLYFGKYRKPDGTVIWTDDYIREVYEAQIPFPVSNKLSIY